MYLGAALAVGLFDRLSPSGVAVLRLVGASLVLLAWRRPGYPAWRGSALVGASAFGLATGVMNITFYEAIARLPLGTAVAIEFCGPVAVAAVASRRPRDVAAVLLAAVGVLLIADVRWSGTPAGVLWALGSAAMWAVYILLARRVAGTGTGVDAVAVGFFVASVLLAPVLLASPLSALADPVVLGLAVGVGVLSSAVPYVLDQLVLCRVGQARFAVLLALLPATAAVIGMLALRQVPGPIETVGIGAVVVAVALRSRDDDAHPV
jgi:inner membrane transporter RhtA